MNAISVVENIENIVENIVSSYESRIQSIESTFQVFEGFQASFFETWHEREEIHAELRESLARNESLRRKDFDKMMAGILAAQEERSQEVKHLLTSYLQEQQEMAQSIRKSLRKFKRFLTNGEQQRIKEFQVLIGDILAKQDQRKNEVTSRLQEFQQEQQDMMTRLKHLLSKGKDLRIRDLKSMLQDFKTQHKERLAQQEQRKQEVRHLLDASKEARRDAAKKRRTLKTPLSPTRARSPEIRNLDAYKN
jgi:hypothetical protein